MKSRHDIVWYAHALQEAYPKTQLPIQSNAITFADLATESYHYAEFVYSILPGSRPSSNYYLKLQLIAESQLTKAGYQLANELNQDLL